ncbi:MAG TPA: thiamine pyrophosphate-binding protein [Blastocatellia bacterium]|nr:thiamine pyrophosphate-binding protein [Blastocatellia bacterium]
MDAKKKVKETKPDVSRRKFITKAMAGAGATAVTVLSNGKASADDKGKETASAAAKPISVPDEFAQASKAAAVTASFPMSGAQVFARICKEEGLAALFCCPGNYSIQNAIALEGIPTYSGRHEGAMCHAADGFCRVTGEVAAASGTEGPGFTDMINAIAAANAARSPVLVLASNMAIINEDTEAGIQLGYQQPNTEGLKKYGKRLITAKRIHEYGAYAFRQLRSGVPRPVHLDFPAEITRASFKTAGDLDYYFDKARYRTTSKPYPGPKDISVAVDLLKQAQRPIIVSSNGVFYSRAWDALKALAEKAQIPVVESGAMKGQFSDENPLSANAAPGALASADVVLLVGQYCMPTVGEFAFGPDAKYIRVDPNPEDIGRNLPVDVGIVSCEKAALETLADAMPAMKHDAWVAEIAAARKKFEDELETFYAKGMSYSDAVHPAVIAKELTDFMYRGKIAKEQTTFVSGGYGIARYVRRWLRGYRPGQILNGAYQYGAIGPDVGYAFGASVAMQNGVSVQAPYKGAPVIAVTGDAGIGYTIMELETASKYRMPMIVIVYNNNAWGTWTGNSRNPVTLSLHLFQENVRYDKVAEGLGAHGEYVTKPEDFRAALERCYQLAVKERRPSLINCQAKKEFWIKQQYEPGFLGTVEPGCMSYNH